VNRSVEPRSQRLERRRFLQAAASLAAFGLAECSSPAAQQKAAPRQGAETFGTPGGAPLVSDSFARTVNVGWGSADIGGAWTLASGKATDLSVSGGEGRFAIGAAYYKESARIVTTAVEALEFEATYDVVFNSDPRKLRLPYGGVLAGVVARYIDPLGSTPTTGHYRFGLVLDASPTADWPSTSGLGIRIQNPYGDGAHGGDDFRIEVPAPTNVDTDYPTGPPFIYSCRARIQGSKPTSFFMRVWKRGTREPSSWSAAGTDHNNRGPQISAPIGFKASNDANDGKWAGQVEHVATTNLVVNGPHAAHSPKLYRRSDLT
jgi:hypothetical protein